MEKPSKRVLTLDSYQHGVVIHALNELRNDLIHEQRPTDIVDEVLVKTMLSNSEMLILLNQAPSDREKLAALLNISPEQTSYITNAPAGCGLLRYGGALVPFRNQFPRDTELYRLMTTKPDESIIVGGKTK